LIIMNKYIPLPKQTDSEFWTVDRLEHIRKLAMTGEPIAHTAIEEEQSEDIGQGGVSRSH
jgi:glutamate synthase (NADPH) GltB2 subunit (EC 1.4.1.13)